MNNMRLNRQHWRWCAYIALLACAQLSVAASVLAQEFEFDIERKTFLEALKDVHLRSNMRFHFLPTEGPHADEEQATLIGPLKGRYTVHEALEALLAPVGFSYEVVNEDTVMIWSPFEPSPFACP